MFEHRLERARLDDEQQNLRVLLRIEENRKADALRKHAPSRPSSRARRRDQRHVGDQIDAVDEIALPHGRHRSAFDVVERSPQETVEAEDSADARREKELHARRLDADADAPWAEWVRLATMKVTKGCSEEDREDAVASALEAMVVLMAKGDVKNPQALANDLGRKAAADLVKRRGEWRPGGIVDAPQAPGQRISLSSTDAPVADGDGGDAVLGDTLTYTGDPCHDAWREATKGSGAVPNPAMPARVADDAPRILLRVTEDGLLTAIDHHRDRVRKCSHAQRVALSRHEQIAFWRTVGARYEATFDVLMYGPHARAESVVPREGFSGAWEEAARASRDLEFRCDTQALFRDRLICRGVVLQPSRAEAIVRRCWRRRPPTADFWRDLGARADAEGLARDRETPAFPGLSLRLVRLRGHHLPGIIAMQIQMARNEAFMSAVRDLRERYERFFGLTPNSIRLVDRVKRRWRARSRPLADRSLFAAQARVWECHRPLGPREITSAWLTYLAGKAVAELESGQVDPDPSVTAETTVDEIYERELDAVRHAMKEHHGRYQVTRPPLGVARYRYVGTQRWGVNGAPIEGRSAKM